MTNLRWDRRLITTYVFDEQRVCVGYAYRAGDRTWWAKQPGGSHVAHGPYLNQTVAEQALKDILCNAGILTPEPEEDSHGE